MRASLMVLVVVLLVGAAGAEPPAIEGRGEWGPEVLGLCCRVTTDKGEYRIGDVVRVLVEVRNTTDRPIALGLEPLIEIKGNGTSWLSRQGAELVLSFSQGSPGFFSTQLITFPRGSKSEARAVVVEPKGTFSEVVEATPWGPTHSSIPATAQPGPMRLKAAIRQFLTPDLKKTQVEARPVELSVKAAKAGATTRPAG